MNDTSNALVQNRLRLERYASELQERKRHNSTLQRELQRTMSRQRMASIARSCRTMVDRTVVWRFGVCLVFFTLFGGLGFIFSSTFLGGGILGVLSFVIALCILIWPSDVSVDRILLQSTVRLPELSLAIEQSNESINVLSGKLASFKERDALLAEQVRQEELKASAEHRRRKLLAENWKALRSVEFEQYLERVFTELGFEVETTRITGDQGVDLIVKKNGRRIAIQVKGYLNSVGNGAIQEAHTGKDHYRCDASAVITNSRFTPSAVELARSVRCTLIGENEFPALVMGRLDFWSLCIPDYRCDDVVFEGSDG